MVIDILKTEYRLALDQARRLASRAYRRRLATFFRRPPRLTPWERVEWELLMGRLDRLRDQINHLEAMDEALKELS